MKRDKDDINPFKLKEVSLRLVCDSEIVSAKRIIEPEDAISLVGPILSTLSVEAFCVINMKADGTPINYSVVSKGCLNHALVSPAELIKLACLSNAQSIILVHNHPSGNFAPSKDDIATTNTIIDIFSKININVFDHIIIGGNNQNQYYSMKEKKLVDFKKQFEKMYSEPQFFRIRRGERR